MGESRASKDSRRRLEEQQRQADMQRNELLVKAQEKSPLEQGIEASRLRDVNYFNQEVPDYSTAPRGLIDSTIFQQAALNRLRERTGTGASQLGSFGANPSLLALNRQQQDQQTAEAGAGNYASNLAARRAESIGGADATIGLNIQRALALSGQASQNAQVAGQNLANFRPAPSGWAQFGLGLLGAGAGVAGAYLGRPRS